MIIRFFKSQQIMVYPVCFAITLLFWITGYAKGFVISNANAMPFYNLLLNIITPEHTFAYFFMGFLLVLTQSFHLNIIVNKHLVLYKFSYLPGLFYLLLICAIPQFISFHPVLIINSILLFVIEKIFRLYKNESPLSLDFDVCALLSIMTMIWLPSIVFVLLYAISIIILRPFSWRDWVVGAIGFLTPIFFALVYYFLSDRLHEIKGMVFTAGITKKFDIKNVVPAGYPLTIAWVVSLFALSLFKIRNNFYKNAAKTRNYQQIVLFMLIISLLLIIFTPQQMLFRFSILCIPLSIIIAYYFLATKKIWITETLFYILCVFIIYNYIAIR